MNNAKQIAATILQQLGGNKILAMMGSRRASETVLDGMPGFFFSYGGGMSKNIAVLLDERTDTYRLRFYSFSIAKGLTLKKEFKGVYCDQLNALIEKETGLYTSL